MVYMLISRQGRSFLRSGHLFVACAPDNGTIFDVAALTHLQQGLVSPYVASPCAWLIGFVASASDSQDEI
jgi:hypothetical protein